jgi:hypothetical protein
MRQSIAGTGLPRRPRNLREGAEKTEIDGNITASLFAPHCAAM